MIGATRITALTQAIEEARVVNNVYDSVRDEVLMEHPWSFSQKRVALTDMTRTAQDDWATLIDYETVTLAHPVADVVLSSNGFYYKCAIAHKSGVFATDLAAVKWVLYTTWVTGTAYTIGTKKYNAGIEYSCLVNHTAAALFTTDLALVYWVATELVVDMDDELSIIYYLPTDFLKVNALSYDKAVYRLIGSRLYTDTEDLKIQYTFINDTPSTYSGQFQTALATRLAAEICFNITQSMTKAMELLKKYESIDLARAMSSDSQQGTPESITADEWENARLSTGAI
jgi:hypothetical protein